MAKKQTKDQAQMEQLQHELAEVTAMSQRALADYQNLQKRVERERQQFVKLATVGLVARLLPVVDHLRRAAQHVKDAGLAMIVDQLVQVLADEGVTKIDVDHKPFDPLKMECVERVSGKKDEVIEVVEEGYVIQEQVIRPAKVKVGTGKIIKNN